MPRTGSPAKKPTAPTPMGDLHFMGNWYPIQDKQKDGIGRPDTDAFDPMTIRGDRKKRFFVALGYTHHALHEIDAFFRGLAVREILHEEIAKKLA